MTTPTNPPNPDRASLGMDGCPQCGHNPLESRQCKLFCPNCGYVESCEDLFPSDSCQAAPMPPGKPDWADEQGGT